MGPCRAGITDMPQEVLQHLLTMVRVGDLRMELDAVETERWSLHGGDRRLRRGGSGAEDPTFLSLDDETVVARDLRVEQSSERTGTVALGQVLCRADRTGCVGERMGIGVQFVAPGPDLADDDSVATIASSSGRLPGS